jgi:hypothetical protein
MYAQVCTRPDLAFVTGMLGIFQSKPGLNDLKVVKKVLRYLQSTKGYMHTLQGVCILRNHPLQVIY